MEDLQLYKSLSCLKSDIDHDLNILNDMHNSLKYRKEKERELSLFNDLSSNSKSLQDRIRELASENEELKARVNDLSYKLDLKDCDIANVQEDYNKEASSRNNLALEIVGLKENIVELENRLGYQKWTDDVHRQNREFLNEIYK